MKLGRVFMLCAGLLVILVILAVAGVVAVSYTVPRRYYSQVTMELRPENSGPAGVPGSSQPRAYDPQYVQRQLAILQKTEILYPVIQQLDLTKAYAPPGKRISLTEAERRLRASMKLQEVRTTGLIEIGIFDTDAQRAANIANAIAVAYQEITTGTASAQIEEGRRELEAEIVAQGNQAGEAARLAMEIRARHGIADPDPEKESASLSVPGLATAPNDLSPTQTAEAIAAKAKMTEYVEAKQRAIRARKVLETMELSITGQREAALLQPRAKIWEKAQRAEQPENRIASLIDSVLH